MHRLCYCYYILKNSYFTKKKFLFISALLPTYLSFPFMLRIPTGANFISVLTWILMNMLLFHLFFICAKARQYFYIVSHFLFD